MKSNTKYGLSFCLSSLVFSFFIFVFLHQSVWGASVGGNTTTEETDESMCGIINGLTYYTFADNNGTTLLSTTPNLCINGTTVSNRLWNATNHIWTWQCSGFGTIGPVCTAKESRCGDGIVGTGKGYTNQEQCDDGNANNNDACKNNCQPNLPVCGEAKKKTYYAFGNNGTALTDSSPNLCPEGQTVANRSRNLETHKRTRRCLWEGMGGSIPPSAVCDAAESRCGDGFVGTGIGYNNQEQCDDGNTNDTDVCKNNCTWNASTCGAANNKTYYAFGDNGTALTENSPNLCPIGQTVTNRSWDSAEKSWTWRCLWEGMGGLIPPSDLCTATESRCGDGQIGEGVGYTDQEQCDGSGQAQCGQSQICDGCQCKKLGICGSAHNKTYYSFGGNGIALTSTSPNLCITGDTVANRTRNPSTYSWSWNCVGPGGLGPLCEATESRCGDGQIGDGIGYTNQESCDGEGKAQCGWSEICNSAACQCQIFEKGICGDAAYMGFNSDEQVSDAGLCAPGSTLVGSLGGKGPRVWQCKGEDKFVQNSDGTVSIVHGTVTDCESYPLGKIEKGRLQLEIPRESQRDIVSNDSILNSTNSKNSLRAILKLSNEWLWIGLLVVLFGVLVYTGFYLITSVGDGDKMKTGLRMLFYAILGFVIALLSWAIVSLVTSMF